MRVVSLNLAGYKDWGERSSKIVDFIDNTSADLMFFQEVRFDPDRSPLVQTDYINSLLKTPFLYSISSISRYYEPSVGRPYREGLAVLSRHSILKEETLALAKASDDKHQRIIQNLDIDVDGKIVGFSNIHLSNNHNSVSQFAELLSLLELRGEKRIILGDFNIFDIDKHGEMLDGYTTSTSFTRYISYPEKQQTLDYILLPNGLKFESLEVVNGLSDHSALVCDTPHRVKERESL